jgi:large subunit ribosomal protein L24
MRIRKNDLVVVITGDYRPTDKEGARPRRVLRILKKKSKVVVEGANMVWCHVRRSQKYPQGGRIEKEAPIDVSNVMLWCDKCSRGVRAGARPEEGRKLRVCKKCGAEIPFRRR